MKKISLNILILLFLFSLFGYSQVNDWEDIVSQKDNEKIKQINKDFNLRKIESYKDYQEVLIDYFLSGIIKYCQNYNYYPIYRDIKYGNDFDGFELQTTTFQSDTLSNTKKSSNLGELNVQYSKTNIQKIGVDEPDILKNNGKNVFYYSKKLNKIYIIQNIYDGKIDLNKVDVINYIKVPKVVSDDVKLFLYKNRLIVMGTRHFSYDWSDIRTDVLIFDITNVKKIKLVKFLDVRGKYSDARLIGNKLYLVSNYDFSIYVNKICNKYWYKPFQNYIKSQKNISYDERRELQKKFYQKKTQEILEQKDTILKYIEKNIESKFIDLYYSPNKKLKIKNRVYPYGLRIGKSNIKNILYIPEDIKNFNNLKFNVVNIIDIENTKFAPNQYVIYGNIGIDQIHMTTQSLYLVNNYNNNFGRRCGPGMRCIIPIIPRGDFTLVHKLSINGFSLNYINSVILPGRPINQYSMDEDTNGYFRIFTKHWYPERATDLFVLNEKLDLIGSLKDIAPGEDFKSSRFMGDKVFLVTFKATDPLFVIDLEENKNPKIIGELKIPGYSLYLHPLYQYDNVMYLLGIGQEAKEVYNNWSLPRNIKIDLYEIDFNQKANKLNCEQYDYENCPDKCVKNPCASACEEGAEICIQMCVPKCENPYKLKKDYIKVVQLYSKVIGKEIKYQNGGSYTPVFDDPRTFVLEDDKNDPNQKYLYLPVYLSEDIVEKRCYNQYKWVFGKKIPIGEKCYDYSTKKPYFIGVKGFSIHKDKGIDEIVSKNYIDWYNKIGEYYEIWDYKNEGNRVGYILVKDNTYIFDINNRFYDIFEKNNINNNKFIEFNK